MMPSRCIDAAEAPEWIRFAGCCGPVELPAAFALVFAAVAAGAECGAETGLGALGSAAGVAGAGAGLPAACDYDAAAVLTGSISTVTLSRRRSPV
jgi:hypothetical protein